MTHTDTYEVAYAAMVAKVAWLRSLHLPILDAFEADLTVHDRVALSTHAEGENFTWFVGETGTHLVWDGASPDTTLAVWDSFEGTFRCYYWGGSTLTEVETRDDLVMLVEE